MRGVDIDGYSNRHDEIRGQLRLMEGWAEQLSYSGPGDRHQVMKRIVEFLEHYVLADMAFEEREIFPSIGSAASVLRAEHDFIQRWVRELDEARLSNQADPESFRRIARRLFGLLDVHLHIEDSVVLPMLRPAAPQGPSASHTGAPETATVHSGSEAHHRHGDDRR